MGTNLLSVIEQAQSFPQATEYIVSVNSPGGYVDVGDAIYDYLVSLKKGAKVKTVQTGLVGSIATKIFLAGDERLVDERYKFWIHNPFQEKVTGDTDQLRAAAEQLDKTEKDLRKFYSEFSPIGDTGIDGLMKIETGLTADQCIKFGFATGKIQQPVFNVIKTNMSTPKKEDNVLDQIKALLGMKVEDKKKPVAPKAAIPANNDKQNVVVELANNAGSFWIEAEALAEGVPCFMLDEAGQPTAEPVADGDYPGNDGTMITIKDGKVAKLTPGETAPTSDSFTQEQVDQMIHDALAKQKSELEASMKTEISNQIMALKKDVKLGIAPKKAVLQTPKEEENTRSINAVMAQKQEERRKSRFNIK